jgi:hypothetical protein
VQSPEPSATIPLAYAAEIVFELSLMRDECCAAARTIAETAPADERGLEECARLDEALRRAHSILQAAIKGIHQLRGGTFKAEDLGN